MAKVTARTGAAATLLALTLLSGCGGGDTTEPSASASASASAADPSAGESSPAAASSAAESASESAGESTGESAGESAVAPATGPLVEQTTGSLNAPAGWAYYKGIVASQNGATSADGLSLITFYDRPSLSGQIPLDDQVAAAMKTLEDDDLTRQPDVTLDGDPAYRLAGTCDGDPCEYVGVKHDGRDIKLSFTLVDPALDAAARTALVDSVLASFVWKG